MVVNKKNVLTVEIGEGDFDRVAPPLLRKLFEVDRFPTVTGALDLVSAVAFSAVIIRHPLQGMDIDDFLKAVKRPGSASRKAKVALFSSTRDEPLAQELLDRGVDLVLSEDDPQRERDQLLCAMLGIQPRRDTRVLVKINVQLLDSRSDRFVAQTKDVSTSGMFVITRKQHPVGTRGIFEFNLLGDPEPIRGEVEVTRHSVTEDRAQGMGFRFLSFEEDGQLRLHRYVEKTKR